jgi:SAM-dependent methyltransferase
VDDIEFGAIAARAAQRYAAASVTAKFFARGKMASDPVYREALRVGVLPSSGTVVDIGCGQGIMLALFAEADRFDRRIGVETRVRMAHLAETALGSSAEIVEGDARALHFDNCTAAILFDVLQMMSPAEQDTLLASLAASLEPGGVMLVREADAAAGWRFRLVRASNQAKARIIGTWRTPRHYRTREEWLDCFDRIGLDADVVPTPTRNPLGNVLFRLKRR